MTTAKLLFLILILVTAQDAKNIACLDRNNYDILDCVHLLPCQQHQTKSSLPQKIFITFAAIDAQS